VAQIQHGSMRELQVRFVSVDQLEVTGFDEQELEELLAVMACENKGRQARVIEIDPRYVDAMVKRWQAYTGRCALLVENGRSFDEVASERLANQVVPE
jgi:hypothetical protein